MTCSRTGSSRVCCSVARREPGKITEIITALISPCVHSRSTTNCSALGEVSRHLPPSSMGHPAILGTSLTSTSELLPFLLLSHGTVADPLLLPFTLDGARLGLPPYLVAVFALRGIATFARPTLSPQTLACYETSDSHLLSVRMTINKRQAMAGSDEGHKRNCFTMFTRSSAGISKPASQSERELKKVRHTAMIEAKNRENARAEMI